MREFYKMAMGIIMYLSQMKLRKYILFLLFVLSITIGKAESSSLYFRRYLVEDGLSNNIITCIHQDTQGYMWFGTRDGLNRFDGYSFNVFRFADLSTTNAGGSNIVRSIATDKDGNLWVGMPTGIYKYDTQAQSFELIPISSGMNAKELTFAPKGDLWLILDGKLVNYHLLLNTFQTYTLPDNGTVVSFCLSPSGEIWAALNNGMIYQFNPSNGRSKGFDMFTQQHDVTNRALVKIKMLQSGDKILVGTNAEGVKLFDIATGTYTDILAKEVAKTIVTGNDFLQVDDKTVWVATTSGLFIYDLISNTYTVELRRPFDPYTLSNNSLYNIYKDKEGGIWIGTYAGGINYMSPFNPFEKFYAYPEENAFEGDVVHDICTDSYNNLWIATEDAGLNKRDALSGLYTQYTFPEVNLHGLVPDGDSLWVASLTNIYIIDIPSGKIIKSYDLAGKGSMVSLRKLPNGKLLAGTSVGAYCYNASTDTFDLMSMFPYGQRVQVFYEDRAGVIFAGTVNKGVYYYNPADNSSGRFVHDTLTGASSNTINDIYQDKNGDYWFATMFGITKVQKETGQVTRYTTENGLPSNSTFRILADDDDNLWISTTNGLVCMNPSTEQMRTYKQDHGLITNQFNYNSSWKDPQGYFYFGMVRGMIRFKPREVLSFATELRPYITGITVFSKKTDTPPFSKSLTSGEHIVLNSHQSTFNIDISALSFIAPHSTSYSYCMDGLNNSKWTYVEDLHTAHYTQLPHGTYTFKVRAYNTVGRQTNDYAQLKITILRPWYLSIMAIIVYVMAGAFFVVSLVYAIIRKNKERVMQGVKQLEYDKEKELYHSKFNFFINIAHEIRTPLTLIKSPLEKAMGDEDLSKDTYGYLKVVEKNADRLLALVNQLLDFRKTELDGYRLSFVKIDIVAFLQDYYCRFIDTVDQKKLKLTLSSNLNVFYAFADRDALSKIISNLLSNALKYASSKITVSLIYEEGDSFFDIDVSNDGEPVEESIREKIFEPFYRGVKYENKSGTGLGLPLSRSLAEMHRGTLTIHSNTNEAITFRVHLPISQPNSILLQNEENQPLQASEWYHSIPVEDDQRSVVLVVEDNEEMLEFLCSEVGKQYKVLSAANGKEALSILEQHAVHLVVSDVMMPIMDGFELLKTVKSNLEYSHIPVVLLTAKNTIQSRIEGLELGADAYIEKPFSMDVLMAQIANLLSNRNSIRNFYSNSPIAHLKTMAYSKADEEFLDKLNGFINDNLDNVNLDVDMIASKMNISRPTLYRKINAISNLTPNELIRICRLKKAAEYISEGKMSLSSIADMVGFNSQSYFSRSFTKQFNISPSEYARTSKNSMEK